MKILFTADIHIKLGQKNVPVDWAKNRYKLFIEQLVELAKQADLLVIGGDIFDKLPNMEELEIYYELVASCPISTIIYSGNHESLKKNTTFFTYLKNVTNIINPSVVVVDDYYTDPDNTFDIIPYNKLKEYNPQDIDLHSKILFTHVRGDIPPFVKAEINLDLLNRWQTVLAGDLHSYENCQRNILYPGSPVTTSFHRSTVRTGVILFDTVSHEHSFLELKLPQLIRKNITVGEPMVATNFDHTIYEVEGDMSELSNISDNDLIDKKIVIRETDTALILDPNMSLQEEVSEYLLYVLNLEQDVVDVAINVLNNNMNKIND